MGFFDRLAENFLGKLGLPEERGEELEELAQPESGFVESAGSAEAAKEKNPFLFIKKEYRDLIDRYATEEEKKQLYEWIHLPDTEFEEKVEGLVNRIIPRIPKKELPPFIAARMEKNAGARTERPEEEKQSEEKPKSEAGKQQTGEVLKAGDPEGPEDQREEQPEGSEQRLEQKPEQKEQVEAPIETVPSAEETQGPMEEQAVTPTGPGPSVEETKSKEEEKREPASEAGGQQSEEGSKTERPEEPKSPDSQGSAKPQSIRIEVKKVKRGSKEESGKEWYREELTSGVPGDNFPIFMESKGAGKMPETEIERRLEDLTNRVRALEEQNEALQRLIEALQGENERLREENEALTRERVWQGDPAMRAFADFWAGYILRHYPYYGFGPGVWFGGGWGMDTAMLTWQLPWIVRRHLEMVYPGIDPTVVWLVYNRIMEMMIPSPVYQVVPGGYPPVPPIANINIATASAGGPTGLMPPTVAVPVAEKEPRAGGSEQETQPQAEQPKVEQQEEEESPEEEPKEAKPEDSAVAGALENLINKYSLEAGRGKFRGAVLPIAGAIGGSTAFSLGMGLLAGLSGPIIGAAATGLGSLVGSELRRMAGENAFTLWARYSHVEKQGGIWGGIKTAFRYFSRGLERLTMKKIIGLEGRSKEIQELERWYHIGGVPSAVRERLQGDPAELKRYLREALWYVTAVEVVQRSGGYLHENERAEWTARALKVSQMADSLLRAAGYEAGQDNTNKLLEELVKEIEEKEKNIYGAAISVMAVLGAGKALVGATIIDAVKDGVIHLLSAHRAAPVIEPALTEPTTLAGEGVRVVYADKNSFGDLFESVTRLSADNLWAHFKGIATLRIFFEANLDNQDLWRYLAGLADGKISSFPLEEAGKLAEVLRKIGINAETGDFVPDAEAIVRLTHDELLTLVRQVSGRPGWVNEILGHPLGLNFPEREVFVRALREIPSIGH